LPRLRHGTCLTRHFYFCTFDTEIIVRRGWGGNQCPLCE
jgi:hypothetical protein